MEFPQTMFKKIPLYPKNVNWIKILLDEKR